MKTYTLMLRLYALICFSIFTSPIHSSAQQITIFSDDFEDYTNGYLSTTGVNGWQSLLNLPPTNSFDVTRTGVYNYGEGVINNNTLQIVRISKLNSAAPLVVQPGQYRTDVIETVTSFRTINANFYSNMTLEFDWRSVGEFVGSDIRDYGEIVYRVQTGGNWPTIWSSFTTGGYLNSGKYYNTNSTTFQQINLPSSLDGQIFQIGFRWNHNANSTGNFPGFCIDNLIIKAESSLPELKCGDSFTDSGGLLNNYSDFEDLVWTIYPDDPANERVSVNFSSANIEVDYDFLAVHDGPDTSFPEIPGLSGDYDFLISYISTHPSGALTFRFTSDYIFNYEGWEATIQCVPKTDLIGDCAEGNLRNPLGIENGYGITNNFFVAADYIVPAGQTFELEQVVLNILSILPPDNIELTFYRDNAGLPGTVLNTQTVAPTSAYVAGTAFGLNSWRVVLNLNPIFLHGSPLANTRYWIKPRVYSANPYYWEISSTIIHNDLAVSNNSGTTWASDSDNKEAVYSFNGKCYQFVYWDDTLTWRPNNPDGTNGPPSTTNDNILVIDGQNASFNNDVIARHLTVKENGILSIWKNLKLEGDILNDGNITFKSNQTSTGQFDEFNGKINGTGSFTTEKFYPARRAFRFVSSPINTLGGSKPFIRDNWQEGVNNPNTSTFLNPNPGYGTHITGSSTGQNGFDATPTGNPSLFGFENNSQSWFNISNTNATDLKAGHPWRLMVRGDRSINVTLNASPPTNTVIRTTGKLHIGEFNLSNLSNSAGDLNFIGNPYQAAIDMVEVINSSTNINPSYYYIWDPMLGGEPIVGQSGGRGAYVTVLLPSGTNTSGSTANRFLQPGQAAFVYTLNNGPASLLMQENHKHLAGLTAGKIDFEDESFINVLLYNSVSFEAGETPCDGTLVQFSEEGINEITFQDAPKLTNLDENLSINIEEEIFSIENRKFPLSQEKTPLKITQYRASNYVFEINTSNLPDLTFAFLHDKYLNATTALINNETTIYPFEVNEQIEESISPNRFEIIYKVEEQTMGLEDLASQLVLYPNPTKENSFYIEAQGYKNQILNIVINNMVGQILLEESFQIPDSGKILIELPPSMTKGIYNVLISKDSKKILSKKLIKN